MADDTIAREAGWCGPGLVVLYKNDMIGWREDAKALRYMSFSGAPGLLQYVKGGRPSMRPLIAEGRHIPRVQCHWWSHRGGSDGGAPPDYDALEPEGFDRWLYLAHCVVFLPDIFDEMLMSEAQALVSAHYKT